MRIDKQTNMTLKYWTLMKENIWAIRAFKNNLRKWLSHTFASFSCWDRGLAGLKSPSDSSAIFCLSFLNILLEDRPHLPLSSQTSAILDYLRLLRILMAIADMRKSNFTRRQDKLQSGRMWQLFYLYCVFFVCEFCQRLFANWLYVDFKLRDI